MWSLVLMLYGLGAFVTAVFYDFATMDDPKLREWPPSWVIIVLWPVLAAGVLGLMLWTVFSERYL